MWLRAQSCSVEKRQSRQGVGQSWSEFTRSGFLLTVTGKHKIAHSGNETSHTQYWDLNHFVRRCSSPRSRSGACGCPLGRAYREWSIMQSSEHPPPWLSSLTLSFPAPFHMGALASAERGSGGVSPILSQAALCRGRRVALIADAQHGT